VDVDDDDGRRAERLVHELVDDLPHAVCRVEVQRTEHVEHGDAGPVAGVPGP
jgi:hypothetical protein